MRNGCSRQLQGRSGWLPPATTLVCVMPLTPCATSGGRDRDLKHIVFTSCMMALYPNGLITTPMQHVVCVCLSTTNMKHLPAVKEATYGTNKETPPMPA